MEPFSEAYFTALSHRVESSRCREARSPVTFRDGSARTVISFPLNSAMAVKGSAVSSSREPIATVSIVMAGCSSSMRER